METSPDIDRLYRRRIDKIFLAHMWLCAPFSRLIVLFQPANIFADNPDPTMLRHVQAVAMGVTAYLLVRTWIVLEAREPGRWRCVWPVADAAWVTALLAALHYPVSPVALLYLFPITYAAFTLPLPASLATGALCAAGYAASGWPAGAWLRKPALFHPTAEGITTVAFRLVFLMLMSSLVSFVGREAARLREQLALAEYQRDLSAEMHDGIQHDLVLIARRLDLADALRISDPDRAALIAVEQRDTARRASEEIRTMVRGLRAGPEGDPDFGEYLRRHLAGMADRTALQIKLTCTGDGSPVPPGAQHALLRIVQEAVTNTVKHANASRMDVTLGVTADRANLTIRDDGAGFDTATASGGSGLETMRSRAETLGGSCIVESRPGHGVRVAVSIPARRERKVTLPWTNASAS